MDKLLEILRSNKELPESAYQKFIEDAACVKAAEYGVITEFEQLEKILERSSELRRMHRRMHRRM